MSIDDEYADEPMLYSPLPSVPNDAAPPGERTPPPPISSSPLTSGCFSDARMLSPPKPKRPSSPALLAAESSPPDSDPPSDVFAPGAPPSERRAALGEPPATAEPTAAPSVEPSAPTPSVTPAPSLVTPPLTPAPSLLAAAAAFAAVRSRTSSWRSESTLDDACRAAVFAVSSARAAAADDTLCAASDACATERAAASCADSRRSCSAPRPIVAANFTPSMVAAQFARPRRREELRRGECCQSVFAVRERLRGARFARAQLWA